MLLGLYCVSAHDIVSEAEVSETDGSKNVQPPVRSSPVLVQSFLLAGLLALVAAVSDLVVNFGSNFVLQLQNVLKGHVGEF